MKLEELMDEFIDELLSDELFKSNEEINNSLAEKFGLNFLNVEEIKELSIEELKDNYIETLNKMLDLTLGGFLCQLSLTNIVDEAFLRLKTSFKEA